MLVYWVIFLVLATGALLNQEESASRTRMMFVVLASVPTALMIGARYQIGADWFNYLDQFKYSRLFSFNQAVLHADPGYSVLNWLIHQFNGPYWLVNFICAIVFVGGLTAFCARQPNSWLAYLVAFPYLVIVLAMSGNRQSLALGFLFFALNAFERGKLYRFALLTITGAAFHGSVLLMLPLCLLSYTSNRAQRLILLLIVGGLGIYFFQEAFNIYARRYSSEKIQSTGVAYRLAMNGTSAMLFLLFERRFGLEEHQARLWRNISICTLALGLLLVLLPSSTAIDRFLLYLFPLQFVVLSRIPKVLTANRQAAVPITLSVIAYAALVQITFLVFGTFASYYVPYRTILLQ